MHDPGRSAMNNILELRFPYLTRVPVSSLLPIARPQHLTERMLLNVRLLSSANTQTWIEGWLSSLLESHPPPDVMKKYLPSNPAEPASAATIFAQMEAVGRGNNSRNKLPRVALNYLLRACHSEADLQTAKTALELYRHKGIEISEEIALLFVKACCRIGASPSASWTAAADGQDKEVAGDADEGEDFDVVAATSSLQRKFGRSGGAAALATLLDPSMRVGLWSNATCWNYALARLDGAIGGVDPATSEVDSNGSESEAEGETEGAVVAEEEVEAAGGNGQEGGQGEESREAARRVLLGFEAMQASGVAPNGQTHHLVARAYLSLGDVTSAKDLVERARIEGHLQESTAAMLLGSINSSNGGVIAGTGGGEANGNGNEGSGSNGDSFLEIDEEWPEPDEAAFPPEAAGKVGAYVK